jgi:hypothetical protein
VTPARSAELVLVTPTGDLLGRLPPVAVETPWWQDVEPVVRAIRARDGIAITVLRLLEAEHDRPPGGRVTYLAETADPVALLPWSGALDEQPLRQAYAKPGGPAADLAWAESVVAGLSPARTGPAVQIRTWNLSSLWRVPVQSQTLWLKVVPAFFAHEGALLERLAGERVPRLLGRDGGRMLLAEISGADLYEATLPQYLEMVNILVGLQRSWMGRAAELGAIGLPDWRGPTLTPAIADVVTRTAEELPAGIHAKLERFSASCQHASPHFQPAASAMASFMAISIPAISVAMGATSPCSTGVIAGSAILCWIRRPSWTVCRKRPAKRSGPIGWDSGALRSRAQTPRAPRHSWPPSPPPARPSSIAASSTI